MRFHDRLRIIVLVRKFLTIVIASLLIPGSGLPEIQHVAGIVQHYHHHVSENGERDLSLIRFLLDHYGTNTHSDAQHEQLPFHGCNHCNASPIVYVAMVFTANTEPSVSIIRTMQPEDQTGTTHRSGSVFQPPRA